MEKNTQHLYPDVPPPYTPFAQPNEASAQPVGYPNAPPAPSNVKYEPDFQVPIVVPQVQTRIVAVGPDPIVITCPSCHAEIRTELRHEPSTKTHLMAILLLLLCWPCTCVPYCVDSCQNANHYCPNCNAFIGSYQN